MSDLAGQHCAPCAGDSKPLDSATVSKRLAQLSEHWTQDNSDGIEGHFDFRNYYQTQAFVNAVAWIAHREDHHPDITFGYKTCRVRLTTHAIGGLSINDFIVAAKIDQLQG